MKIFKKCSKLPVWPDTRILSPFRYAPFPTLAVYDNFSTGLQIIPITGFFSISSPMEIAMRGRECTKFIVPSTGSIIHVGSSPNTHFSPLETDSSPINLCKKPHVKLVYISDLKQSTQLMYNLSLVYDSSMKIQAHTTQSLNEFCIVKICMNFLHKIANKSAIRTM